VSSKRRAFPLAAIAGLGAFVTASVLLAWPSSAIGAGHCPSPEIRVYKREGELELWCGGAVARTMPATFGANPIGPKIQEGDERTPEGAYTVSSKTVSTRFHRFLAVSYPNDADRARARASGVTRLGGGIGIHGTTPELAAPARAWTRFARAAGIAGVWGPTDGCIGVANEDVELLYATVPIGARITIAASRAETH
jgi:murein L,D-transpeptidase YafK